MCLTCKIISTEINPPGGIIYQDRRVILHHCLDINIPGYLILSPLRHTTQYQDLTGVELAVIHTTLQQAAAILQQLPGVEKIYICSLGEETTHFHFHVFPRYRWMLNEPDEAIRTDGKIDGAKLFSFMRVKHKISPAGMLSSTIFAAAEDLRNQICISDGGAE
ncbi:histidine triad (hit) protein [Lucifera butyrica]|uniref:Histidine triad (Hit) protein n=1 Tax=Lucifera butyrica TaxID=1351585 RepID=A0A498RDQ6_9FIRM|nr:HIT family protein [Lucifera butyrica]VBB07328.1 histidine triad (hit) protein [Lucifera butyrica]